MERLQKYIFLILAGMCFFGTSSMPLFAAAEFPLDAQLVLCSQKPEYRTARRRLTRLCYHLLPSIKKEELSLEEGSEILNDVRAQLKGSRRGCYCLPLGFEFEQNSMFEGRMPIFGNKFPKLFG